MSCIKGKGVWKTLTVLHKMLCFFWSILKYLLLKPFVKIVLPDYLLLFRTRGKSVLINDIFPSMYIQLHFTRTYVLLHLTKKKSFRNYGNLRNIYELFLMKIYVNAKIFNKYIFQLINYDLSGHKGQIRSLLCLKINFFIY